MRERGCIPERAPILIVAATPASVEVDVLEAVSFETGRVHRIRLGEDVLLIHDGAGGYDRLLAVGAPAKIGFCAQAIYLRDDFYGCEREDEDGERRQTRKRQFPAWLFP